MQMMRLYMFQHKTNIKLHLSHGHCKYIVAKLIAASKCLKLVLNIQNQTMPLKKKKYCYYAKSKLVQNHYMLAASACSQEPPTTHFDVSKRHQNKSTCTPPWIVRHTVVGKCALMFGKYGTEQELFLEHESNTVWIKYFTPYKLFQRKY